MANVSVAKIKIRRGTDSDRKQVIFDNGELAYVTDVQSRRLFIGDGSTRGGNPAGTKFYTGNTSTGFNLQTTQVGDIIFNTNDTKLYSLTGVNLDNQPDYSNPNAYQFIGPRVDDQTLEYASGAIRIKSQGVDASHITDSLFDFTQGFSRPNPNGSVSVKTDGTTIKINGSGQLYVDTSLIALNNLQTTNLNFDGLNLGINNLPTGTGGLTIGSNKLWLQANTNVPGTYYVMLI